MLFNINSFHIYTEIEQLTYVDITVMAEIRLQTGVVGDTMDYVKLIVISVLLTCVVIKVRVIKTYI